MIRAYRLFKDQQFYYVMPINFDTDSIAPTVLISMSGFALFR
ncbi:hypothetical protein CRENPOLYSF2_2310015 [Crenothrix polyspora]|uniref:Uncharacterized protein n=1 Tax=Crenothrix polyspora TaxID=360316 RepID=A0A1R4H621_9GAMM|nr:hypothetical protein CRENPOLYSF2_2310015 [Crenothrix polyspora]